MPRKNNATRARISGQLIGSAAVGVLVALGILAVRPAASLTEDEIVAICREAEDRYKTLFGQSSRDAEQTIVLMYKMTFCPGFLEIKRGETIRWVNVDRRTTHSVWFKEAARDESDRLFLQEHVQMTIDLPAGDHPYICGPHWEREGMIGALRVR